MSRAALEAVRDDLEALLARVETALAAEAANDAAPVPSPPEAIPAPPAGPQNPAAFFDALRADNLLGPVLTQEEVSGCEAILKACAGVYPTSWAAYALATAYHEVAGTMQPIRERGGEAYLRRMYDIEGERPEKARELGNTAAGDGIRYSGRGYVQLTGKANYELAGTKLGYPLVTEPDLALDPDVAARILVIGMRDGWFTGKTLREFIPAEPGRQHFINARRVVNGQDRADLIAGYAVEFLAALRAGDWK